MDELLDTLFTVVDAAAQRSNVVLGGEARMAIVLDMYVKVMTGCVNNKATTMPQINLVWPGKKQ